MHPNETRRRRTTLALMTAAVLSIGCTSRTMQTESSGVMAVAGGTRPAASAVLTAWPMKQRETATMLIGANAADPDKPHTM